MQDLNSEIVIRPAELPEKEVAIVSAKPHSQPRSKRVCSTKTAPTSSLSRTTNQRSRSKAVRERERISLRVELEGKWLLVLAAAVVPALRLAIKILFAI